MDPPIRLTSGYKTLEAFELGGKNILKDQALIINVAHIQRDPTQWQMPDSFIPERFDP